jgi:hypothetical protein
MNEQPLSLETNDFGALGYQKRDVYTPLQQPPLVTKVDNLMA